MITDEIKYLWKCIVELILVQCNLLFVFYHILNNIYIIYNNIDTFLSFSLCRVVLGVCVAEVVLPCAGCGSVSVVCVGCLV